MKKITKEEAAAIELKMGSKKSSRIYSISIFIGIVTALLLFLFFGIPSDVIENQRYMGMIPAGNLEMFFLISTSLLFGTYIGLSSYLMIARKKAAASGKTESSISFAGLGGTVGSFFAISCPICIVFLVWIFGATFLMKYYDPIRPVIGFASIGLIGFAIYNNIKIIRNKGACKRCID